MGFFVSDLTDTKIYTYTSNQYNVNFFDDAGSPSSGNWLIYIKPGVIIGSTNISTPAAATGNFPGRLTLVNRGRIQGKGGDGGYGFAFSSDHYGGGGGGAGTDGGTGGESGGLGSTGPPGENGTSEAGGAGGDQGNNPNTHEHNPAGNGETGGTALQLDMDIILNNTGGEIWGGGGGGGGDGFGTGGGGGAGGNPGEAGADGTGILIGTGGAAGTAIDQQDNSITWKGGSSSPNIKGSIQ